MKVLDEETGQRIAVEDNPEQVLVHPNFELYPERNMLKIGDDWVNLKPAEREILGILFQRKNRFVPIYKLRDMVYTSEGYIRSCIMNLRKKIDNGRELEEPIIGSKNGAYALFDFSEMPQAEKQAFTSTVTRNSHR